MVTATPDPLAGLSDDAITAMIDDTASILDHATAAAIIDLLDREVASIRTQISAAEIAAGNRPLTEEAQAWAKRAAYAAAIKGQQRQRVERRDKELRGLRRPPAEPKSDATKLAQAEEGRAKQERLRIEAETQRARIEERRERLAAAKAETHLVIKRLEHERNYARRFVANARAILPPEWLEKIEQATPPTEEL